METASLMAPKVIYMAACLLSNAPFEKNANFQDLRNEKLTQGDLLTMKGLRKSMTDGYGYLVLADRLLRECRK